MELEKYRIKECEGVFTVQKIDIPDQMYKDVTVHQDSIVSIGVVKSTKGSVIELIKVVTKNPVAMTRTKDEALVLIAILEGVENEESEPIYHHQFVTE